ncbi:HAUS augmin-like complex subunit 3 isoform X2 [Vombatus ursinus]|uniref:HAUS augmin-like complex subunit 3 isoform X2 n=1 Tax=Vombatus ursinus TaxID=29139 RepID=UPI000FFD1AB3|nr:HAUS augmin-like complex subunit 3 isoform X2 [Vombatus ursinus]
MSCGNEFVETLKKIGYPKSDNLNGEDFDWLFETVENKPFLEWFCRNVNEQHVLTEKELQAFSTLQKSSKPILEEQALDEVLKTCKTSDLKTSSLEGIELEKLETELQALQKLKNLKIQRRNKFQLIASANSHRSRQLNAKEEEVTKNLKESQGFLNAVNTKITNQLKDLIDGVEKLTSFFGCSETKQGTTPPVFLSQLALEKYLSQEGQSTVALTLYTKKHFFQGIQELVESSNEENFQLFDIQTPFICGDDTKESHEERRLELARLQLAYVCAQHQLIQLKANECSLQSCIKWAEETLQTLASKAIGKEDLEAEISSFSSEILKLEEQITQLNNKTLPAVVKENAQLLNMPVVKGDFDLQLAKQDYYTSRQELVLNQLIKQKASFELLQLAYEIELRKHRDTHRQLESLTQELSQSNTVLHQRLEMLADPSISQQTHPRNTIDAKDCSTHRLNNGVDMLCDTLYCGGNQLYLSDQELKEQFHQVDSHLKKLNHLLMDILANVKAKRRILATDKLYQMERELYVYFFKDKEYLQNIVENLEHQLKITTVGLED